VLAAFDLCFVAGLIMAVLVGAFVSATALIMLADCAVAAAVLCALVRILVGMLPAFHLCIMAGLVMTVLIVLCH
jgi:hypothetical protein